MRHLAYGLLNSAPVALSLLLYSWLHGAGRTWTLGDLAVLAHAALWGAWVGWASARHAGSEDAELAQGRVRELELAEWQRRKDDLWRGRAGS